MFHKTMRAFACALTTTFALTAPAMAAVGDTPTVTDLTTGASAMTYPPDIAVGDTLRGDDRDWAGNDIYVYQWHRCWDSNGDFCEPVEGATARDYVTTANDWGLVMKFCAQIPRYDVKCSGTTRIVVAEHADSDSDGTPDYSDACATTAGPSNGCPAPAPVSESQVEPAPAPAPAPATVTAIPASDPSARGAANGVGATDGAKLTALIASRVRSQKVRFGRKVVVTGRLRTPDGAPISGATLAVLVKRNVPGAQLVATASAVTRSDGTFAYTAPAGPSRVIQFAYRAFGGDTTVADTTDVTLLVTGALTLKAPRKVRNGTRATFTGKLRGRPVPATGVLVDLQVWFHKKWRTFATPRASRKGTFKFKYRFTRGAARWTFRARIRKDSLYPYELGYSGKVKVRVTR